MLCIQRQAGQNAGDNRVLASVYNMTASTLARGAVVQYYTSAAGVCDGFSVTIPTTNYLDLTAGIVADAPNGTPGSTGIATLTCGFIVIYGVTSYANLYTGASVVPAVGDKLVPVAGQTYLQYVAAGDGRDGLFCCLSSYASSSATSSGRNISVYVHAM